MPETINKQLSTLILEKTDVLEPSVVAAEILDALLPGHRILITWRDEYNGDSVDPGFYAEILVPDNSDLPDEPHLGLATTRELLDEIATRMQITQNSTKGRELGSLCREALDNLSSGVLGYKTVMSDG